MYSCAITSACFKKPFLENPHVRWNDFVASNAGVGILIFMVHLSQYSQVRLISFKLNFIILICIHSIDTLECARN